MILLSPTWLFARNSVGNLKLYSSLPCLFVGSSRFAVVDSRKQHTSCTAKSYSTPSRHKGSRQDFTNPTMLAEKSQIMGVIEELSPIAKEKPTPPAGRHGGAHGGGGRAECWRWGSLLLLRPASGVSEVPEASCQSLWKLSTLASHPCTTTAGARLHTRLLWLCHAPICPCVCVGSKKLTTLFHNKTTLNTGDATSPRPRKFQVFLE